MRLVGCFVQKEGLPQVNCFLQRLPVSWFMFLLQVGCHHLSQDTVTLKQACVVTFRTSRVMMLTGNGGEDPPRPHTRDPEGTTLLDSVRVLSTISYLYRLLWTAQWDDLAYFWNLCSCAQTNLLTLIDRILPAHGSIASASRSEHQAAVPPSEGLQGASVSRLLLPHVRLWHRPAQHSPREGRRGRGSVATERRAEHRLAEGQSRLSVWQPASGKSRTQMLLYFETIIIFIMTVTRSVSIKRRSSLWSCELETKWLKQADF